jgi:hypothetical protein
MAQQTAVPLDRMAQHLFGLVDALDAEAVKGLVTGDCEEVDEISRTWRRGRVAIADYFDQVLTTISDVHTDVGDVATRDRADTGVVTCVIDLLGSIPQSHVGGEEVRNGQSGQRSRDTAAQG